MKHISESDLSKCHYYKNYISSYMNQNFIRYKKNYSYELNECDNPSLFSDKLNNWIYEIFPYSKESRVNFITQMVGSYKDNKLDLSWLNGSRIVNYVWCNILLKEEFRVNNRIEIYKYFPYYSVLDVTCSSTEAKVKIIKRYFDIWIEDILIKNDAVSYLKEKFFESEKFKHPFKELKNDRDGELIDWTWKKITKKANDLEIREIDILLSKLTPASLQEKYEYIFVIFDFFIINEKKLFKLEYSAALSKRKYTHKENQGYLNLQLDVDVINIFNELKSKNRCTQPEMLKILINDYLSHSLKKD